MSKTRRSPRYRVTGSGNRATLEILTDDPPLGWEQGEIARYWAATGCSGYVYRSTDERPGTLGRQVCAGLAECGNTITIHGDLSDLIRREARALFRG